MSLYDWLAILLYLSATIAIGLWMSRKQEDLDDYFLGGRSFGKLLQTFAEAYARARIQ